MNDQYLNRIMQEYEDKYSEIEALLNSNEHEKDLLRNETDGLIDNLDKDITRLQTMLETQRQRRTQEINRYIENLYLSNPDISDRYVEAVRRDLESAYEQRESTIQKDIDRLLSERQNAQNGFIEQIRDINMTPSYRNVYLRELADQKDETRKKLISYRREIENRLQEERIRLSQDNLNLSRFTYEYDDENRILNGQDAKGLLDNLTSTQERINELNILLERINGNIKSMEVTEEETKARMVGLTPLEQAEYDRRHKAKEPIQNSISINKNIDEPIEPEKPPVSIADDKNIEPVNEEREKSNIPSHDIDAIIDFIRGEDSSENYKWYDNFVYTSLKSKYWNWHKTNERTFLDKPIKLVKTAIGSVMTLGSKGISSLIRKNKNVSDRINKMVERVNSLSEDQIKYISTHWTAIIDKSRFGVLPKVVRNALQTRLESYSASLVEKNNQLLKKMYFKLIDDFNICKNIVIRLQDNSLSLEQRSMMLKDKQHYDNILIEEINSIEELKEETDNLINKSGIAGMRDNYKFGKANLIGGRNSSSKDHSKEAHLAGTIGNIKNQAKDGYEYAAMYIYKQKVFVENTVQKRTLKNRGGKANVGAYEFTPYVEAIDYTPYEYAKDVMLTVTAVMSTLSVINQIKQASAFQELGEKYNELSRNYNTLVSQNNAAIDAYNNLQAWTTNYQSAVNDLIKSLNQGGKEAVDQLESMLKTLPGSLHGSVEYAMMHADAGSATAWLQSSGRMYNSMDDALHATTSNLTSESESLISGLSGASISDKLQAYTEQLQKTFDSYKNLMAPLEMGNREYISTWTGLDHTAITSLFDNINNVNPGVIKTVISDVKSSIDTILAIPNLPPVALNAAQIVASTSLENTSTLIPAIGTLASVGVLGMISNETKEVLNNTRVMTEALKDKLNEARIDVHEQAKEAFEEARFEWNNNGYYTLIGKKINSMPTLVDVEQKILDQYIEERRLER